ncbi:MAG: MarR family transcriptional regulator [Clostridia bacterium]|nr:MarR family transcriptional regulator [Clostridia bacterium]
MEQRFESFTALITKISRSIRKIKNQEMQEYNLRAPHISCLYYLYCNRSLTATELCERCEEDKATISRTLDYLEENGYIICESKAQKRYKSPLSLTEKGEEVGEKIYQRVNGVLEQVGKGLSEEERVSFYRCLTIISNDLEGVIKKIK